MKKNSYLILTIAIISLGLLLTGGTYAWLIYGNVNVGNNTLTGNVSNFIVDYTPSLSGELFPSSTDKGGLSGTVTVKINDDSSVPSATGKLYLYANSNTSSILYQGTELGIALKYSLYDGETLLTSGTVNSDIVKTGEPNGMLIYDELEITQTLTTYTVYVWLDGNLVDNRYLNVSFSGALNLEAIQD